jgi:hypothetical protein
MASGSRVTCIGFAARDKWRKKDDRKCNVSAMEAQKRVVPRRGFLFEFGEPY